MLHFTKAPPSPRSPLGSRFSCLVLLTLVSATPAAFARSIDRETAFIGYTEKTIVTTPPPPAIHSPPVSDDNCKDSQEACSDWAAKGECRKNSGFMIEACPESCSQCERIAAQKAKAAAYLRRPKEYLVIATKHGDINIRLRGDLSPRTVQNVKVLANASHCRGSQFHRSEKPPAPGAVDQYGGPGPPYALLQGSFASGWRSIAKEGAPLIERGMVAIINGGPHWFISTNPHHEWQHGFGVWGEVENMELVDFIIATEPTHNDNSGAVRVQNLKTPLKYTCRTSEGTGEEIEETAGEH